MRTENTPQSPAQVAATHERWPSRRALKAERPKPLNETQPADGEGVESGRGDMEGRSAREVRA